ncbi:hypothetical protein KR093_004490, partial [Drosophila rubida]
ICKFEKKCQELHLLQCHPLRLWQLQLAMTAAIACIFIFSEPAQEWLSEHFYILWIALGVFMIIVLILSCCQSVARKVPINYILLIVCTAAMSMIVSVSCVMFPPIKVSITLAGFYFLFTSQFSVRFPQVLMAVGITAGVVFVLALFAMFAPCDFTGCGPYLCVLLFVLLALGIVNIFIQDRTVAWIMACLGIAIYSLYIVYDMQMMIGGHRNQYDEEDYIIAALSLYIDIVQLFMHILILLGLIDE